ncbi:MAG: hypothetical protein UY48_C0029G0006 [Candidatus Gottesmanbacteria bacterium GW2011_GWB1_49_7]|uniref:Uncharacterized protein n=1 Tax=Candidatus Gottesmanbacteria bacterium GW2011_GWB1_49_7 TaxID=1618448 RepID=A0A0G1YWS5_9BACT|nr:MAG: hypothetical protein UY48_C0029G0006 [Candidatus Gottesmanbacteria bacterium GW2011_GWB1_49_7]
MFVTIKVRMSGNVNYPSVAFVRDGIRREYGLTEASLSRVQSLFDEHAGRIYVDLANSEVELTLKKALS